MGGNALRIAKLTMETSAQELTKRMDQLYNKGKEEGWPKEVMDYLMWWEHETCRISYRLTDTAKELK
jgi:hypothetical protein